MVRELAFAATCILLFSVDSQAQDTRLRPWLGCGFGSSGNVEAVTIYNSPDQETVGFVNPYGFGTSGGFFVETARGWSIGNRMSYFFGQDVVIDQSGATVKANSKMFFVGMDVRKTLLTVLELEGSFGVGAGVGFRSTKVVYQFVPEFLTTVRDVDVNVAFWPGISVTRSFGSAFGFVEVIYPILIEQTELNAWIVQVGLGLDLNI